MSGNAVLQVVILRDGLLVGTEVFVPGQYALGSGESCELRLEDPHVAEAHAQLFFQNGKVAVQDLGGNTGVFVNGHKVTACEVRPVDELAIGPFSLKVRVISQQKPQAKQGPSPEIAALLGGRPPAPKPAAQPPARAHAQAAPARPPSGATTPVPSTVVSSRRMGVAQPQASANPMFTPPAAKQQSHLRAVQQPLEDGENNRTEAVNVSPELLRQAAEHTARRADAPQKSAPPPAPPPVAKAPAAKPHAPPPAEHAPAAARPARTGAVRPQAKRKAVPLGIAAANEGKGTPKLFFELYWGDIRKQARSFGTIKPKKPVTGGADDTADVPLYGFNVPDGNFGSFVLAEQQGDSYRVFIPPGAALEKRGNDGNFYPLGADQLEQMQSGRRFVSLSNGTALRLSGDGDISMVAYVQAPIPRPFVNPLRRWPWLAIAFFLILSTGLGAFIMFNPPETGPDFTGKNLTPVAVKLIKPEPKKKEEAKKKLEEIKEKKQEKKVEKKPEAVKEAPKLAVKPPPIPKALEKITAAGPALNKLLAKLDSGGGPGKKDMKNDYKLSGLIGKQPIANAGLGTFGLGGGGSGGSGIKGIETLRGLGGGGIGALGAGRVGKGAVGGTVTRATSRTMGVQGTIDKEAVAKVINSHLAEISACYERALLKEAGLAGKIVLEWNISTAGIVTTAKTKSSTMKSAAVEGCILNSLKGWKFPPAKGAGVVISYPFMFNSVGY